MNTLAAKIAKASTEVGGRLRADKTNTQDRYDYISANKILAECGQALAAVGVAVIPSMTNADIEIGETAGGKRRFDARVTFVMTITDGETESSQPWYGFGADYTTPDKAVYKAITSGHKYFLSKLMMIGEGNEDGEHESLPDSQPAAQQYDRRQTNGKPAAQNGTPPAATQEPKSSDAPSEKQMKMLYALGVKLYGKENWVAKRAELVKAITKGRSESAADMTKEEMSKMLDGLKKKADAEDAVEEIAADPDAVPEMPF